MSEFVAYGVTEDGLILWVDEENRRTVLAEEGVLPEHSEYPLVGYMTKEEFDKRVSEVM